MLYCCVLNLHFKPNIVLTKGQHGVLECENAYEHHQGLGKSTNKLKQFREIEMGVKGPFH